MSDLLEHLVKNFWFKLHPGNEVSFYGMVYKNNTDSPRYIRIDLDDVVTIKPEKPSVDKDRFSQQLNIDYFIYYAEQLAAYVHETAVQKGWWEKDRNDFECLCLVHSELSEAVEGLREGNPTSEKLGAPFTQVEEEIADVFIRLMDLSHKRGWRVFEAIREKMKYNYGRDYRHGGKVA